MCAMRIRRFPDHGNRKNKTKQGAGNTHLIPHLLVELSSNLGHGLRLLRPRGHDPLAAMGIGRHAQPLVTRRTICPHEHQELWEVRHLAQQTMELRAVETVACVLIKHLAVPQCRTTRAHVVTTSPSTPNIQHTTPNVEQPSQQLHTATLPHSPPG